jgi:hypothetical protein
MQSGKLAALARGEVVGILGDTEVIGTAADQPVPPIHLSGATHRGGLQRGNAHPLIAIGLGDGQQAGISGTTAVSAIPSAAPTDIRPMETSTAETARPVVRAPFKLDLSDSEDDD